MVSNKFIVLTDEGLIKICQTSVVDYKIVEFTDDNIIRSYQGRLIDLFSPIRVYRNLHFKDRKVYSIKQFGLVVAHAERLCLHTCKYHVSEKGRQRIIKRKKKEVVAYIEGILTGSGMETSARNNNLQYLISFNPYNNDGFIYQKKFKVIEYLFTIIGEEVRTSYINKFERI